MLLSPLLPLSHLHPRLLTSTTHTSPHPHPSPPRRWAHSTRYGRATPKEIAKAVEVQQSRHRKIIDEYIRKYNKTEDQERITKRKEMLEQLRKGHSEIKIDKMIKESQFLKQITLQNWKRFNDQRMKKHYDKNRKALKPILSKGARDQIRLLSRENPFYWTPARLGHFFDIDVTEMRFLIWEMKLEDEAREAGDMLHPRDLWHFEWKNLKSSMVEKLVKQEKYLMLDPVTKHAYVQGPPPPPIGFVPPTEGESEAKSEAGAGAGAEAEAEAEAEKKDKVEGKVEAKAGAGEEAKAGAGEEAKPKAEVVRDLNCIYPKLPLNVERPFTKDFGIFAEDLREIYGKRFGVVESHRSFEPKPTRKYLRHITKKRNCWFYLPPGLKRKELLNLVRSKQTVNMTESPRIPPRPIQKPVQMEERVASGAFKRGKLPPGSKQKLTIVDSSPCYDMYNRPIIIRDTDNTWRTATWDERRLFQDNNRYIRRPRGINFDFTALYPDEQQPDGVDVSHRSPRAFFTERFDYRDPQLDLDEHGEVYKVSSSTDFSDASPQLQQQVQNLWERKKDQYLKDVHMYDMENMWRIKKEMDMTRRDGLGNGVMDGVERDGVMEW